MAKIVVYLGSELIQKYQFKLCSKYYREHDFEVVLTQIAPCRKLRRKGRKNFDVK